MAVKSTWKSCSMQINCEKVSGDTVLTDQLVIEGLKQDADLAGVIGLHDDIDGLTEYPAASTKMIDVYELTEEGE